MDISCIFFGLLFTAAGILFALGKLHRHIPAWKAMAGEDKKKINIAALCRNIGGMIGLCGVILLARGFAGGAGGKWFIAAMVAWLIAAGLDVWHISKSSRYQNK